MTFTGLLIALLSASASYYFFIALPPPASWGMAAAFGLLSCLALFVRPGKAKQNGEPS